MTWTLLALALVGCDGENNLEKVYPTITVYPEDVYDFGEVVEDYSATGEIVVSNGGPPPLSVASVSLSGDGANAFRILTAAPFTVDSEASQVVTVSFTPPQQTEYTAVLTVESNDEEGPVEITLTGTGIDAPAPDIDCDPLSIDFGTVPSGSWTIQLVECTNVGDGPLNVGAVDYVPGSSGSFTFDDGSAEGATLAPDQSAFIPVTYAPTNDAGDNGSFTVESDDPDEPTVQIQLLGNGGGTYQWPVADIVCPSPVEPRSLVTLDGSGSYDPADFTPLEYHWTLTAVPDGSAMTSTNLTTRSEEAILQTDIAGEYIVTLQVENTIGLLSAPEECVMQAIPTELFHVELSWNTGAADLDLHVMQAGNPIFDQPGDCNYCNPNPDWGVVLDATDDPTLDIDDWSGYGPENTNIDSPADGDYDVKVHYYTDNSDGDVTATVRIWLNGEPVSEFRKVMEYDQVWDVASISWPSGVVLEESTALYDSEKHACF